MTTLDSASLLILTKLAASISVLQAIDFDNPATVTAALPLIGGEVIDQHPANPSNPADKASIQAGFTAAIAALAAWNPLLTK